MKSVREELPMFERRKTERIKSLLKAKIVFNNRMTSVDCVIKNISPNGARLVVDKSVSVANEFDLEIPMKGKTHRALMRWRDADSMGVEFMDAAITGDHSQTRIQKLEVENARLKATVVALTKRLEDLGQDVQSQY